MPPVASRTLQATPAHIRHLLLSNRIRTRGASWKSWFNVDSLPSEELKHSTPNSSTQSSTQSSTVKSQRPSNGRKQQEHGRFEDPIPRKEEVLQRIDNDDVMKAFEQGPKWMEALLRNNTPQRQIFEEDETEARPGRRRRTVHSIDAQERQLKRKIKQLERQLALDKDEWHFHRMSYAELPPAARQGFLKVVGKTKEEVEGDEVLISVPNVLKSTLNGLNECLVKAGQNMDSVTNAIDLWRHYCRCKWRIPNFLANVTDRAWTLIWQSQDIDSAKNPHRFRHLKVLTEDMKSVAKHIAPEQETRIVEAHFETGEKDEALWVWEEWYEHTLNKGELAEPEAMELGIQMHCRMDNLERAEQLVKFYFNNYPRPNPRALLPIIDAFAKHDELSDHRQALAYYTDMKRRLGSEITMKDFDSVSLMFFRAKLPMLALMVFTDLMNHPSSPFRGPDLDLRALNRARELIALTNSAKTASYTSLSLMTVLPRRLQNKYFFGSWLKKLIGLKELDAAGQVIELMFERGISPAPLHLNGLCLALFNTGKPENIEKAERLLWTMIRQRIHLVEQRRGGRGVGVLHLDLPHKRILDADGNITPEYLERQIPAATAETFGVLAHHYRKRHNYKLVPRLSDLLRDVELPMSPYFLTQYVYAKASMTEDYRNLWTMFRDVSVWCRPSVETYEIMWKSILYRVMKTRYIPGQLTPQHLFSHMSAWMRGLEGYDRQKATSDWDLKRYTLVLHLFLRVRDLPGAIVALHAMGHMFGNLPSGETVKEVVRGLAMLSFQPPGNKFQMRKIVASTEYQENTQATFVVLQALYEEMTGKEFKAEFKDGHIPDNSYGPPAQLLDLLTQLIWVFASRNMEAEALRKAVWVAKNNMDVQDMKIGTIGAFTID